MIPGTEGLQGLPDGLTEASAAIASWTKEGAGLIAQLKIPGSVIDSGFVEAASSFASSFWVAWALVVLTLVPALFLPRKREVSHLLDDEGEPPGPRALSTRDARGSSGAPCARRLGDRSHDQSVDVDVVRAGGHPRHHVGDVLGDERLVDAGVHRVGRRLVAAEPVERELVGAHHARRDLGDPHRAGRSAPAAASRSSPSRRAWPRCSRHRPRRRRGRPSSEMLISVPAPLATSAGTSAFVTSSVPMTLTSYMCRHTSGSASVTCSSPNAPPALLTSRSSRPPTVARGRRPASRR